MVDDGWQRIKAEWGLMAKIGRELGLSSAAVPQWRRVPPERVLDVERITGVPRHELRPDLYPPPGMENLQ